MRYAKEYIIAILVVALLLAVWVGRTGYDRLSQFEKNETRLKTQLDSITALRNKYAVEYLKVATELNKAKLAISNEREANKTLRKRNETLKNRPVRAYSDSAAMREITRLVGEH